MNAFIRKLKSAIIVAAFLIMHIQNGSAQIHSDSIPISSVKEWMQLISTDKITISIRMQQCEGAFNGFQMNRLLFRIENKTNKYLAVDWDNILYYNERNLNPTGKKPEHHKRFALRPKQTIEATCNPSDVDQTIYVSIVGQESSEELKSIQLLNVTVFD